MIMSLFWQQIVNSNDGEECRNIDISWFSSVLKIFPYDFTRSAISGKFLTNFCTGITTGLWCVSTVRPCEGGVLLYCQVDCVIQPASLMERNIAGAEDQICARHVITYFLLYFCSRYSEILVSLMTSLWLVRSAVVAWKW